MAGSRLTCPSCDATLKTAAPLPDGKKIKCPKCATLFTVGGEAATKSRLRAPRAEAPRTHLQERTRPPGHKAPAPRIQAEHDDDVALIGSALHFARQRRLTL